MNNILSSPLNVILSITNNCNLHCLHCFSSALSENDTSIEFENWKTIIPILSKNKVFSVRYSGGEPLSVPWFQQVAEKVASLKMNSGMNTNATLVTPQIAKWLKLLPMRETIIVGIDGMKDSHERLRGFNTFDRAVKGLQYLVDNDLNTELFCVITQLNYKEIAEIYKLSKLIGVKRINFNKLCLVGRSTQNQQALVLSKDQQKFVYETILSLDEKNGYIKGVLYNEAQLYRAYSTSCGTSPAKSIGCGNGFSGLVIYSNGDCAPCEMLGRNAICGNLFKDSLETIWRSSSVLNAFRELKNTTVDDIEGCKYCKIKNMCGGTCRAEPFIEGNILGKGSMCVNDLFSNSKNITV